jgi:hypothetical protein
MEIIPDFTMPTVMDTVAIDSKKSLCKYSKVLATKGQFKFVGTYFIIYEDGTQSHYAFQGTYEVI